MISSLADNIADLSNVVADQLTLCTDLETVLREKRECLVQHRLEQLQALSQREQALAHQLGHADGLRQAASAALAQRLGLHPEAESSRILTALPAHPAREQLAALMRALSAKLYAMYGLNEDNRILASNLLEYTGMVLRLLAHGPGGVSYSASGRLSDGAPRPMLDDRI